ncbi:hypothetical protein DRE_04128 [Drechslerella stenobrocha 248]|uniref:Threonine/serine exporter-like N-terminal domain-containing protein n=1 Tax=Drechslerella stenobrocha 248 TaxID=1043628 RepID=W7HRH4_9PEZI|nr:hypothetical protein DRE_04128 [Drechslerella stenobrocha 248]
MSSQDTTGANSASSRDDNVMGGRPTAHHVRFDSLERPPPPAETTEQPTVRASDNQADRDRVLEAASSLPMAQGPIPLLAADNRAIKREVFDEEAVPARVESAADLDPPAETFVRKVTQKLRREAPEGDGSQQNEQQQTGRRGSQAWHSRFGSESGLKTPVSEDYQDQPPTFKPGVLATLLKLAQDSGSQAPPPPPPAIRGETPPSGSGAVTPSRWYKSHQPATLSTAALLAGTSAQLAGAYAAPREAEKVPLPTRPKMGRSTSGGILGRFSRSSTDTELKLRYHIAHTLQKQRYLLQLCRALMLYGAPTHRLEEYLKMSARVLDVEGQFLYLPGCMLASFDDSSTHTSNMQLVRVSQSLDLGKLQDVHLIYKEVVHDLVSVEEGSSRLQELFDSGPRYNVWFRVFVYGAASAAVGPLFGARLIDLPICFMLGIILGTLALVIAPKSNLYSNVFEIVACVIICFLARAFGSINGGTLFCFSGIAQASIALILPGYIVLCGALELQSKNMVAGSVRMFYAIVYSLLLGFGITIGAALYGALDATATSSKTCADMMSEYYKFLFVFAFTLCLNVINQCKWRQLPISLTISLAGFTVNFFATRRFRTNVQIANALGAFAIGVMGNLYSRLSHQIAFTSIVPAIFIQVPSGLAAQGGLISGLDSADSITNRTLTASTETLQSQFNSTIANVALGMVQVGIGISVGLFFAAIAVYPFGKRRSGLFTF